MWLIFKLNKRRWWVQISDDFQPLQERLQRLRWLKREEVVGTRNGVPKGDQEAGPVINVSEQLSVEEEEERGEGQMVASDT